MGNDGGSIPDRRDLVRTKAKAEQADKANQTRARWLFCALSKKKLQEPVVSCGLGKLYNKDAIIEFLLDRSSYGDGENICGHIKTLKDLKTLKLTPNPAPPAPDSDSDQAAFICPLTLREMNGVQPFVYLYTCGCTFARAGLKTVAGGTKAKKEKSSSPDEEGKDKSKESSPDDSLEVCPQCAKKFSPLEDVITLNPSPDEEENLRLLMDRRKSKEPSKKSKKRKAAAEGAADEPPAKKVEMVKPSTNPNISAASRAVISSLAMEEAKRKATMSEAVKSLYESSGSQRKETFMTRGTFNRYAA